MRKIMMIFALAIFGAGHVWAQNGGKAEPNRIEFAGGKSAATVSGKIKGDEQAEYVFAAREGQTVTIKIASAPKGKFVAFKVVNPFGEREFVSESDTNYEYTFAAPYSGDYLIWVSFRPAGKLTAARYALTLRVK